MMMMHSLRACHCHVANCQLSAAAIRYVRCIICMDVKHRMVFDEVMTGRVYHSPLSLSLSLSLSLPQVTFSYHSPCLLPKWWGGVG